MGEIKSTLDLVMERTRHLSLTDEEKKRQRAADFEKRLQGLLQQYADGAETVETFRQRLTDLETETASGGQSVLVAAVARCIDPDGDNARWLELLDQVAPGLRQPLGDALDAHRAKQDALMAAGAQDQLGRLGHDNGISGSAVVPNPQQDPACRERLVALREETRTEIEAIAGQI